ncbi:uncharacterized protein LOC127748602 [Frankliniella occidentalis]|uniref:Uncharacterized protein LOC127748602 n=1 Tax=Frankliniella occidentalis TaxID=133901 RepID=A0A9C6XDA8_FRAOC|nr:uncharacterized protein LOC127748602 [Frankliniella occidentalis]
MEQPDAASLLPDDVLLMVMGYLDVEDLLACRLVCKRFGALAVHPDAWRRQVLSCCAGAPTFSTALRFAPCLASLKISLPCWRDEMRLYRVTKCAVSKLELWVGEEDTPDCLEQAGYIIRNQEALGRLKELSVLLPLFKDMAVDVDGLVFRALLRVVACTSGLEVLTVNMFDGVNTIPAPNVGRRAPRSSLKTFRCHLKPQLVPFCEVVLAVHAHTLETVDFDFEGDFRFPTPEALPSVTTLASVLAGMPKLSSLHGCPLLSGLEAVAACESLKEVSLFVGSGAGPAAVQGAADFLRRCKQLREVTLTYSDEACVDNVAVDLVLALVSSGPSLVETLAIVVEEIELELPLPQMEPLSRALPRMPALRELVVRGLSDEVLVAITPHTSPTLRNLYVYPANLESASCAHHYLHLGSVANLLSKNPLLKLHVLTVYYCDPEYNPCTFCEIIDCHRKLWASEDAKLKEDEDPTTEPDIWITIPRL